MYGKSCLDSVSVYLQQQQLLLQLLSSPASQATLTNPQTRHGARAREEQSREEKEATTVKHKVKFMPDFTVWATKPGKAGLVHQNSHQPKLLFFFFNLKHVGRQYITDSQQQEMSFEIKKRLFLLGFYQSH